MLRAIPFMFMHKISTRMIRVNGTCEHPWPRYFDGRKKEQFIPLLISYDRCRCRNVIKQRIINLTPSDALFFKVNIVVLQMRTY